MKKFTLIVVLCMCTAAVFAGPHHGRGGHHGGHRGHYRGNDGVWLAAGITNIVANGIQILNGITYPVRTAVVTPAPVYQQPVVVPQPVYQQPLYQQPVYVQPQPVVVPQPTPTVYYPPQPVYTRPVYTQPVYRYPAVVGVPKHYHHNGVIVIR